MIAVRSIIALSAMSALVFGFQNCSKVAMNEVGFSDASLQAVSIPESSGAGISDGTDSSNGPGSVDDSSNPSSPSGSSSNGQTSNGQTSNGNTSNGNSGSGHSCKDSKSNSSGIANGSSDQEGSQLVECELSNSSKKVVLAGSLSVGSNAQVSRICMSENACLNLVNEYAVSHDCSLAAGAATSPSSNGVQCTKVFPGSKGTCKNSKGLSDDEVSALLVKLGQ